MQKITTFLTFNDQAEEAMNFYISVFKNGKKKGMFQPEEGADVKEKKPFLGGSFEIEGQEFMVLNAGPSFNFTHGISLFVRCETQQEVDDLWQKLTADGGKEVACGWLVDKFGVSWQVIPTILGQYLGDKDPVKSKRVMEAMMKMVKIDIDLIQKAYDGEL